MDWLDTAYTLIKRFNDRTPGIAEGMATAIRTLAPRGTTQSGGNSPGSNGAAR